MGKRILNLNNCTFICPALQGSVLKKQHNHKFNDGTGVALTKETSLTGAGICAILTAEAGGTPVQCVLKNQKNWIDGIEFQKKINGVPLLNENAKMLCSVGNIISVQKPLSPVIPVVYELLTDNVLNSENSENKTDKNSNSKKSDISEDVIESDNDKNFKNEELPEEEINHCICCLCEKMSECPYINATSTISVNGASEKLRKNSPQKEAEYNEYSDRKMKRYKVSWNNQAHHIISINAVYCQYPQLVKLGNYFGYDINCQENCYFLPCWEKDDGYGQKDSHYKKAQAYQVMNVSGLQWHVGQHSYRTDIPDNIKEKYPELRDMDCYNDKVNKDIKLFLNKCSERFDGICPEENYEEHKKWFIDNMNAISETIGEYLNLFGNNPKDSFPYFVSLEALRFAYEVPRSSKVILIYTTATKWCLKKYKFTNTLKSYDIQLELLDSKEITITEPHKDDTIRNLILFCENVSCFLIADELQIFKLPFQYNVRCQYIRDSEKDEKESHFSAMLAEQADSGDNEYESPKAVVIKRFKECGFR